MISANELNKISDKYIKAELDTIHFFVFLEEELLDAAKRGLKTIRISEKDLEYKLIRYCQSHTYSEIGIKDICYNPFYRNYYIRELRNRGYTVDFDPDPWENYLKIDWSTTI